MHLRMEPVIQMEPLYKSHWVRFMFVNGKIGQCMMIHIYQFLEIKCNHVTLQIMSITQIVANMSTF